VQFLDGEQAKHSNGLTTITNAKPHFLQCPGQHFDLLYVLSCMIGKCHTVLHLGHVAINSVILIITLSLNISYIYYKVNT